MILNSQPWKANFRPEETFGLLQLQRLTGSIQSGRRPASDSLRTCASDSGQPISASISPTHPQQSPPQSVESGSARISRTRLQMPQCVAASFVIVIPGFLGRLLTEPGHSVEQSSMHVKFPVVAAMCWYRPKANSLELAFDPKRQSLPFLTQLSIATNFVSAELPSSPKTSSTFVVVS